MNEPYQRSLFPARPQKGRISPKRNENETWKQINVINATDLVAIYKPVLRHS
jgi:hypothetical protein